MTQTQTIPVSDPGAKETLVLDIEEEGDEWDMPTFAFHDLDYVPSGYGGILAPYIETGPGTMRAAATLMRLNLPTLPNAPPQVICDLGCGDGQFLIGLLSHLNSPHPPSPFPHLLSTGFGIDYSPTLISTAILNSSSPISTTSPSKWLVYDFNLDEDDLFTTIMKEGVSHVFVYLVPKQLALGTVRRLLERLWGGGVVICCHKFQPGYLVPRRVDEVMSLVVYERERE